jgi:hypothetical protein
MKYTVLDMKSLKQIDSGAYGTYYKIKDKMVGIKILDSCFHFKKDAISNLRYIKNTEYKKLVNAAKRTRMVPRPKGLALVKVIDSYSGDLMYSVGYMMSHIKGKPFGERYTYKDQDRLERAEKRMEKLGIELNDNHDYNVMKSGKRIVFIDADRFNVIPLKKKRKKRSKKK